MKTYKLTAVIEGETKIIGHEFHSRSEALDYIFNYYQIHSLEDLKINDEYIVNSDKHNIEYVADYNNRFRIARVITEWGC